MFILAGLVSTNNLGISLGHFADTTLEKRRKLLEDFFHFTCTCIACKENFPLYDNMETNFDNKEYFSLQNEAISAFGAQDFVKGIELTTQKLKIVSDYLKEPHQLFVKERAAFLECLGQCYGNQITLIHK